MGGRGASSAGGAAVGSMSDARLKSERARAAKAESAAQDRLRAASLDLRQQNNSDASRERWNAANAAAKAARSRLGAIDEEISRRERATPEYREEARRIAGQREMHRKAAERFARVTSSTWEREKKRRAKAAEGWLGGKRRK